jgi:hypothetical protein
VWPSLPSEEQMHVASRLAYTPRLGRPEKEQLICIVVLRNIKYRTSGARGSVVG